MPHTRPLRIEDGSDKTELDELRHRVATLEAIVGNIFIAADRSNRPYEMLGNSVKGSWEEARKLIEQSIGRPLDPTRRWFSR